MIKKIWKYIIGGLVTLLIAAICYSIKELLECFFNIATSKWENVPRNDQKEKQEDDEDVIEIIETK